jgi:hypothetical protein
MSGQRTLSAFTQKRSTWLSLLAVAAGLALLAVGIVWSSSLCIDCNFDNGGGSSPGRLLNPGNWLAMFIILVIGALILYGGWLAVQASERSSAREVSGAAGALPRWLAGLLVGAALLRLVIGVVWFIALPPLGHGTQQELNGYVMADAYERDQLAWKIAQSPKSLSEALQLSRRSDAYGGLLFFSALVYRYTGMEQHLPLGMVAITAAISALAVLFTWAFARRSWDESVARLAAWGVALYPEAVLLGSSQMREAVIIPLLAMSFYGLARLRREHSWISLAWLSGGILLTLFISPPFTLMLISALFLAALPIKNDLIRPARPDRLRREAGAPRRSYLPWLILVGVLVAVLTGGWFALRQFAPAEITNPIEVASYWIRKSVDLQAYFSKGASGWVQKIFRSTPEWSHLPILISYGVLRPFLPAALTVGSDAPIWPLITLWRAAGWTLLLGMLIYALVRAWMKKDTDRFTRALTIIVWLGILIASLRGGGDQDDNPRYRATFISIQVALAAWAWTEQRRSSDPIFRRAVVTLLFVIFWAFLWYLRRLYPIPGIVADPFKIIGLGLACGAIYSIWDWARGRKKVK